MKIISATSHGFLDYGIGVFLIAAPWLFNFQVITSATWSLLIIGIVILVVSFFTDYPLGAIRKIPFSVHRNIEIMAALSLLISPWLFHFAYLNTPRSLAVDIAIVYLGISYLTNYKIYQKSKITVS